MNFFKYFFKRIIFALLGVFIIVTFSYVVFAAFIKNNEFNNELLIVNYFRFLGSIFKDFGKVYSASSFNNAREYFFYYYKFSFLFCFITFIISLCLGFIIGVVSAYKTDRYPKIASTVIIFILSSIPTFVLAPLALIFAEFTDLPVNFVFSESANFGYTLLSLLLPVAILSISATSFFAIVVKNTTVKILNAEFITIMKATGHSSKNIFFKGVLKNLIAGVINHISAMIIMIISFSLILEIFFQIPGQSLILDSAFKNGEINVLMCLIFFKSLLIFLISAINEIIFNILKADNNMNFEFKINIKKNQNISKLVEKEVAAHEK